MPLCLPNLTSERLQFHNLFAEWQDAAFELLRDEKDFIGNIPLDTTLRDGKGDGFPTDPVPTLLRKRQIMILRLPLMERFILQIKDELELLRDDLCEIRIRNGHFTQLFIEYNQYLHNLVELIGYEQERLRHNLDFIQWMIAREVNGGRRLCGGAAVREECLQILAAEDRWRSSHKSFRPDPELWTRATGGMGRDDRRNKWVDLNKVYDEHEWNWKVRWNSCSTGWSHPKFHFDDDMVSNARFIVTPGGLDSGLRACNMGYTGEALVQTRGRVRFYDEQQCRWRSKMRVERSVFVDARDGYRLMNPTGLNYRFDAFPDNSKFAGQSIHGHPETIDVFWCRDEKCVGYFGHAINACNYACPHCGRRRLAPTMSAMCLWNRHRVQHMRDRRIRLDNRQQQFTVDEMCSIRMVAAICSVRSIEELCNLVFTWQQHAMFGVFDSVFMCMEHAVRRMECGLTEKVRLPGREPFELKGEHEHFFETARRRLTKAGQTLSRARRQSR